MSLYLQDEHEQEEIDDDEDNAIALHMENQARNYSSGTLLSSEIMFICPFLLITPVPVLQ